MTPERFKTLYGVEKPEDDDEIVFSCMMGVRSLTAVQIAEVIGYKRYDLLLEFMLGVQM